MAAYEQYKGSGVKWLGEIPSHWDVGNMRQFFTERKELSESGQEMLLSVSEYKGITPAVNESGENVSRSASLVGYKKCYVGDLIINIMLAWKRGLAISSYDGIVSPAYCVFASHNIIPTYANYLLRTDTYVAEFKRNSTGIIDSRLRMYPDDFKNIKCIAPPIEEQKAIVAYLDKVTGEIDRAIEVQQQMIDALNERIQIIISNAVTKGLNPDVPLRDSGIDWLGQIPAHWQVRRIKTLFSESDERNTNVEYELLSFSRYKGIVPYSSISDRPVEGLDISKYKVIHPGQLLENRMQAWSGMFAESTIHGCVSPDYSVFSAINPEDSVEFFAMSFRTPKYIQQFANASKGIGDGFNRLYTPQFGAIFTLYPPQDEQKKIVKEVGNSTKHMRALIEQHLKMIDLLTERKQIIINQVVTGKEKVI